MSHFHRPDRTDDGSPQRERDRDSSAAPPLEPSSNNRPHPARPKKNGESETPPKPIRWVVRILIVLVVLCLILGVWVWSQILHALP